MINNKKRVGFVIPYYKAEDDFRRCKHQIKRQNVRVEVFVHDNSDDNKYFTYACNEGIKHFMLKEVDYICLVNQDCFLEDYTVPKMINLMESNEKAGIVSPCMIMEDKPGWCIETGGLSVFPRGRSLEARRDKIENTQLLWMTGACWLMRPEMIRECGILDNNMLHFCSDADYCYTVRSRGWEVWRCASAIAIHTPHSRILNDELEIRMNLDSEYLIKKWCGGIYHELSYSWKKHWSKQIATHYKEGEKRECLIRM